MLLREELDITGGQSPCDTGADPIPASPVLPPASPTKVPFSSGGEEPRAASAAAPRQEPAPRRRARAAPQGCKGPADKRSRWAQERHRARPWPQSPAPRRAPLRWRVPADGHGCQQGCSAWPFPRADPSQGQAWGDARQSVVTLFGSPGTCHPQHHQTTITPRHHSGKFFLPAPAGEAAAAKICLALPSLPVPSA